MKDQTKQKEIELSLSKQNIKWVGNLKEKLENCCFESGFFSTISFVVWVYNKVIVGCVV